MMRLLALLGALFALGGLGSGCTPPRPGSIIPLDASAPAPQRKQLTVLYVADLHAQLRAHPELFWHEGKERIEEAGGFARVAAAIQRIRAERGGDVLVLDAGDTLQGSGAAALTEGGALIDPLNALGLDAAVPGNWEVVYGPKVLRQRARELKHPLFAANLRDAASGERLFPPYFTKEVGGVKVAVVGFTDPDVPRRQPPGYSQGLRYDGPEALPALVKEVREREGAQVVLLMTHVGLAKAVGLAARVPGVDVHLSSDTHERTYAPIEAAGTWVVEPGAFGSFLGRLDLWVEEGRVVDRRWELIELTASRFPEDPRVARLVDAALAPHDAKLAARVGHTDVTLARYAVVENPLDNVLADAIRAAGGTEIGLSNGFRFGTPLLPGPVREADLWNFFPIVNKLKTGRVSGRQLRAFWEQELENVFAKDPEKRFGGWLPRPSGMTLRFRADAPKGQRLLALEVGDNLVEDDRLYTVTACEREGDAPDMVCRIPGVQEPRVLDVDAHEAVRRFLASKPRLTDALQGRAVGEDLPPVLRTQQVR
ncbi:bifunctional metallophosphatase/5'-nucleotidase [Pyxidicoccus fallax]|uniref:Bifunctional metallophosphatase/5'-nucleotidase n=1 Tax=Pyxidicoccus fallax TaxID=394095 RepID=A0A848LDZ0_9BACT|nr:bifunctional metallophosphatase/5'-nucleotidase [Pyxidicoccus fallax]NMO13658.1 bifunctional metallophosphatase/5'-nucleotidase [Pyxidicoccus fallax]NPC76854.1 bifunctional metallophosphatase/5'-nucleotidase [Pyxidicoccus fallax]